MGTILCPTRGGEASYRAQDAAIALAKERGKPLVFLYVVDTHFLDRRGQVGRLDVVNDEMARMGQFLLTMAQERAAARGVKAEVRIRHGDVCEELKVAVREEQADVVVLGRPVGEQCVFEPGNLEAFAQEIGVETPAETVIV